MKTPAIFSRQILTAVSINMLASIANAFAGVGAMALLARNLEVAHFGRVILLITAVNAFAIFEGLRPVIIHRVAVASSEPASLFKSAFEVNGQMAFVTMALILSYFFIVADPTFTFTVCLLLLFTVVTFFIAMQYWIFLDAENDVVFTGIARSLSWIGLYVAICGLSFLPFNLSSYVLALFMMYLVLAVVFAGRFHYIGLAAQYSSRGRIVKGTSLLRSALNNIVFNICAVTINVADRAIVGGMMGPKMAGLYAGPNELTLRAVGLIRSGVQVILPWLSRLSQKDQGQFWFLGIIGTLIFVGSGSAILMIFRDSIIVTLLGSKFSSAGDLLGIFGIGILFSTIGYVCILHLNAIGDFVTQRRLYILGATILVVGAAAGATSGSLRLVAAAYLLARAVDLILLVVILRRRSMLEKIAVLTLAIAVTMAILAAWLKSAATILLLVFMAFGAVYLARRREAILAA